MSNNSIRIRTNPDSFNNTRYLKVKLEQDFDFLEILSLNITQEEVYRRFSSDYGVVVGRVIMNNGVGVPNAKVSIFVPLSDEDSEDEEIRDLYPFTTINTKDSEGKRYNLLPKEQQFDCHTPVGTLASKREILDNDKLLDIHKKYYKYTAVTNDAGDYMIFGVPVGTHFINIDVDISDIGVYSQRPYDMIREGTPTAKFQSVTKFKYGDDLDKLPQVKNSQGSVNVKSFWGDSEQYEIGITRFDTDIKYELKPSAIFMGSIFGDTDKNSISKRCRPRKDLGYMCDLQSTEGTMEMIRKDIDGNIERFDVEGGRVINDDGVWAYQVPMNLNYMVTDEFGNLIPSDDPTKGIPTKARVRFRAGMDVTGDEGRLRTRAKYLIPHNPANYAQSDYSFDDTTNDIHFRDMYWNKIYSVKNFIPRFQTSTGINKGVDNRNFIGIKNVDDCTGTRNPFPFNRMDSNINPLFTVLCILITIIGNLIAIINAVVVKLINSILGVLNGILSVLCEIIFFIGRIACSARHPLSSDKRLECRKRACLSCKCQDYDVDDEDNDSGYSTCTCVDPNACPGDCKNCSCGALLGYVKCIKVKCDSEIYAPGCKDGDKGFAAANSGDDSDNPDAAGQIDHYWNDTHGHGFDAGWPYCTSLQLADSLDLWKFDFYNDWVNGSLYAFQLKYKLKRNGKEKFCEYDCKSYDPTSDNNCHNNFLVDSCVSNSSTYDPDSGGVKSGANVQINDGLIKKFGDELYYVAHSRTTDFKLFATDIVNLGSVLDCDWQGIPKIQRSLIPTTYNAPELLPEREDGTNKILVSGYDSEGNDPDDSLFFNINCLGIFTNNRNCRNIARQCEFGVGLDEDRTDEGAIPYCNNQTADQTIDNCELDGLLSRDIFTQLNHSGIVNLTSTDPNQHSYFDYAAYNSFRAYNTSDSTIYRQPKGNSYYFYFGIVPGKSAVELMNSKYFKDC